MSRSLQFLSFLALCATAGVPDPCALAGEAPQDLPVCQVADIDRLIQDLGDPDFKKRMAAEKALLDVEEAARPKLKRASRESPDLEIRLRAGFVLKEASLRRFIRCVCRTLSEDDLPSFKELSDDPSAAGTAFADAKKIHEEEDYLKLAFQQIPAQRTEIGNGRFVLGGHDHGHLHMEMQERDGAWRLVRLWFCW